MIALREADTLIYGPHCVTAQGLSTPVDCVGMETVVEVQVRFIYLFFLCVCVASSAVTQLRISDKRLNALSRCLASASATRLSILSTLDQCAR